jgi:hypothetical protein
MAADLHLHTKISDGSVGIDEVVMLAKRCGLTAIAVTDHDTFAGSGRAQILGKRQGVKVLPGAEFSAVDASTGRKAHILCYLCDRQDRLLSLCRHTSEARRKAGTAMLEKVLALYPITAEMVMRRTQGSTGLYKQHIMHALLDAGFAGEIFGSVFQKLFNPKDGLAYVPVQYPEVHDVIEQIHAAGGLAVLAHPGMYDSYALLDQLAADHEIEGVEVWHPRNREGDVEKLSAVAKSYGLVRTGGTDFHGMYTQRPVPVGTCTAPDTELEKLLRCKSRPAQQA